MPLNREGHVEDVALQPPASGPQDPESPPRPYRRRGARPRGRAAGATRDSTSSLLGAQPRPGPGNLGASHPHKCLPPQRSGLQGLAWPHPHH